MNKGLKNYTKQLTLSIGDIGKASINLNKQDANLHMVFPLLSTVGHCPIEASLIYNHQDKDVIDLFGKGFKLNYYSKIERTSTGFLIKNADGSTDEYLADNNYSNAETELQIEECTNI